MIRAIIDEARYIPWGIMALGLTLCVFLGWIVWYGWQMGAGPLLFGLALFVILLRAVQS